MYRVLAIEAFDTRIQSQARIALFDDYREWCEECGQTPLRRSSFLEEFERICAAENYEAIVKEGIGYRGICFVDTVKKLVLHIVS